MRALPRTVSGNHDQHERQILDRIEERPVTQRRLASDLGIALGLTNLLVRRLVKKGWVRVSHISPRRISYLITPAGVAAKARLTREYFLYSLEFYRESRARVRERLELASRDLPRDPANPGIVFFGVDEVAEVAYVCLQETDLCLVGVVDAVKTGTFFQHSVASPAQLVGCRLAGQPFSRLLVMPLQDQDDVRGHLARQGVPPDAVFWL
jgi:DNA-binding MarR family transcriptional regulator